MPFLVDNVHLKNKAQVCTKNKTFSYCIIV